VVLEIDYAGPSEYECTKHEHAVMVFNMRISSDDCQSFSAPDLVTTVPAPQRMFSSAASSQPRGDGWGLVVAATTDSALYKAELYAKAVHTYYPERSDAWIYHHPTTNLACNVPGSACLSGASLVIEYALSLANLAPVHVAGVMFGVPGTVTGVPTWISIVTSTNILNRTYLEVGSAIVPNVDVLPGPHELAASPFKYDAVFGPGAHLFSSSRAAYGPQTTRVDLMRHKFCGNLSSCVDPHLHAALIANYNVAKSISPANTKIDDVHDTVIGDASFYVTAMPELGATATCSADVDDEEKKPVDVPNGPGFCIPPPPPPPPQDPGSGSSGSGGSGS
jgi:hypothetical protein